MAPYTFMADRRDMGRMGRLRARTLRNIAMTSPYMHGGSLVTLDDLINHSAAGGERTIVDGPPAGAGSECPPRSEYTPGFELDAGEGADIRAFLNALTDSTFLTNPRYSSPWIEGGPR